MRHLVEKWDAYTVDRVKLSKTVISDEELKTDEYRIVIGGCIFNKKNQMLIQKRQSTKKTWANMWDISVSGSAISGETSAEAAQREIKEELGLDFSLKGQLPQLSVSFTKGFEDYYLIEEDVNINEVVLQVEEVQDVKWATLEEIRKMMEIGDFIPYHEHLISLLFEMKTTYGSYKYE